MTEGRQTGSGRRSALAAMALAFGAVACQEPVVGARETVAAPSEGPRLTIDAAVPDLHGHVVATFTVVQDDRPLSLAEVQALDPRFTLATLRAHPVDGLRAWQSEILAGPQVVPTLPVSGPGTPAANVLAGVAQPWAERATALTDLGGGRYRFVFAAELSSFDPEATVRVGAWLAGAAPTRHTSATYDFRPSGGPLEERDTVLDANCSGCHGQLTYHGIAAGTRLCMTCHTWQAADPDTMDPAALVTTGYSAANNPNPLELGRLVHRLHRGKQLPTLFASSARANPAPALAAQNALPLPFSVANNTTPVLGRRFSFVGSQVGPAEAPLHPFIPGRVLQRTENGQARTVTAGILFPRDVRDCAVCHRDAPQAYEVKNAISRRTCTGCHPDVWFQGTPAQLDETHFAHAGGVQDDDLSCRGCHLESTGGSTLYAPIDELHVRIDEGLRFGDPKVEILGVEDLRPNGRPRIRFRVTDRNGPVVPTLGNPSPLWEPDSPTSALVPRKFTSFAIRLAGSTAPDYGPTTSFLMSSSVSTGGDPLTLTTFADTDEYVYAFTSTVPASARGTWGVGIEGRRALKYPHYDRGQDRFPWPGTGETVTEYLVNPVAYVDTATGTWPPDGTPRRKVVAQEKCERCHFRVKGHGGTRNQVQYCLFCHTPTTTDYPNRRKVGGLVDLSQSLDGIEERTVHLKVMVMRLHTGAHEGAASLEAIRPGLVATWIFDDFRFPNDLANCTACHAGNAYRIESVPSDAPPTVANENAWVMHAPTTTEHSPGETARPPIQAACTACHATGPTFAHVASKTVNGVETCKTCHSSGALSVDVSHGLARLSGGAVAATFSSIRDAILTPRCASAACHGAGTSQLPHLDPAAAWQGLVGASGGQSSLPFVTPGDASRSYLVYKLRGDVASVGSGLIMPTDGALSPADIAAIEAWIANGAPND